MGNHRPIEKHLQCALRRRNHSAVKQCGNIRKSVADMPCVYSNNTVNRLADFVNFKTLYGGIFRGDRSNNPGMLQFLKQFSRFWILHFEFVLAVTLFCNRARNSIDQSSDSVCLEFYFGFVIEDRNHNVHQLGLIFTEENPEKVTLFSPTASSGKSPVIRPLQFADPE